MKRHSRYIMTAGIIMICMIVLTSIIQVIYGNYSRKQIDAQATAQFSSYCYQADSSLSEILKYSSQLSEIQPVFLNDTAGDSSSADQDALLFLLLNNLRNNTEWEGIDISFCNRSNPKTIYTPSGSISYSAYQQHLIDLGVDPDFSFVFSRLLTTNVPALYCTVPSSMIMFFLPIGSVWTTYQNSLLLVMEKSFLTSFFSNQPGQVYGFNTYGTALFYIAETSGKSYSLADLYPYTGKNLAHAVLDGKKTVVLNEYSTTGLLTYTAVIPENEFYAEWHQLNLRLILVMLVVLFLLLLAMFLTIYLSNRSWKRIYTAIIGTTPTGWISEDMRTLLHSVEKKQESITVLNERLDSSLSTINRQLVLALINSRIKSPQELDAYKDLLTARLDRPWWLALYLPKPISGEMEDFTDKALLALDDF